MDTFWTTGIIVLIVANVLFFVMLLSLTRELGVLLVRLGPAYARVAQDGPDLGTQLERFQVVDIGGQSHWIEPTKLEEKLLVFTSPQCAACSQLIPGLATLARDYKARLRTYVLSSGSETEKDQFFARVLAEHAVYSCNSSLHSRFTIQGTPYAVLLDSNNTVKTKGIVNNLEHLESLFGLERRVVGRDVSLFDLENQQVVLGAREDVRA